MDNWSWGYNWSGGSSWFGKAKKRRWDSWRPKHEQPFAACFVQDAWTQRHGDRAFELEPEVFEGSVDAGDFFSLGFEPYPEFSEKTTKPGKKHFCSVAMVHPMFASLRSQTRLDVTSSRVAAAEFARVYKQAKQDTGCDGGNGDGDGEGEGEGSGGLSDSQKDGISKAVDKAMEQAQKALDESSKLGEAFGTKAGTGQGSPSEQDIELFQKLYKQYKTKRWMREMIKMAGRLRHIARARQKGRTRYGADAYAGVVPGGSIDRLLSDELGFMSDEVAEMEMLQRLVNDEAECLDTYGISMAAQGPIILLVDESGSMDTKVSGTGLTRFQQAMAIALTVVWTARFQRRWVGLYTFTCGPRTRKLILDPNRPGERDSADVIQWITTFQPGGTDSYIMLKTVPEDVDSGLLGNVRGRADVLVLSDGEIGLNDGSERGWTTWDDAFKKTKEPYEKWKKKHDIKAKGLLIGTREPGEVLKNFCDELHYADDMGENSSIAEAVFTL